MTHPTPSRLWRPGPTRERPLIPIRDPKCLCTSDAVICPTFAGCHRFLVSDNSFLVTGVHCVGQASVLQLLHKLGQMHEPSSESTMLSAGFVRRRPLSKVKGAINAAPAGRLVTPGSRFFVDF